jgi:hypothetical protein
MGRFDHSVNVCTDLGRSTRWEKGPWVWRVPRCRIRPPDPRVGGVAPEGSSRKLDWSAPVFFGLTGEIKCKEMLSREVCGIAKERRLASRAEQEPVARGPERASHGRGMRPYGFEDDGVSDDSDSDQATCSSS